ncbi:hypothetical protein MKW98_003608 [Papaver atlanticum]|uniref:Cysteine-rich transmembrane CYSTM domain-containing protein n=1 Tax=Papaver atlanticum TaxID=357466 RepID=A0AAD4SJ06_9MAGN|nr:hypothetical protein MKW98_003608 [Papaver atlanticum]
MSYKEVTVVEEYPPPGFAPSYPPPESYPPVPPPPGYVPIYPPPASYSPVPPPPGFQGYFNDGGPPPQQPYQQVHEDDDSGCCPFLKGCAAVLCSCCVWDCAIVQALIYICSILLQAGVSISFNL